MCFEFERDLCHISFIGISFPASINSRDFQEQEC